MCKMLLGVSQEVDRIFLRAFQSLCGYGVKQDLDEGFRLLGEGIKLGDPSGRCQGLLGVFYYLGLGRTEQDEAKAAELWSEGDQLGDSYSQSQLGFCYRRGRGVVKDEEKARQLYLKAHRQGYVAATYNLAVYYEDDDIALRAALYREAAARGLEFATNDLVEMRAEDPSSVIPFGCWAPHVHKWVSDSMHQEMNSLLLVNLRRTADSLLDALPKM